MNMPMYKGTFIYPKQCADKAWKHAVLQRLNGFEVKEARCKCDKQSRKVSVG